MQDSRVQIMACPIHLRLLFSRVVCFATTLTSMLIYSWNVSSGRIRVKVFRYLDLALMIQISMCAVELVGQLMSMWFGSTTPVPNHLLLCVLLILSDWLLAFFTVGTMCASLGVLTLLISNGVCIRSVNVRAMIHCLLSLVAGASALVSAFLSSEIAKARHHQARA